MESVNDRVDAGTDRRPWPRTRIHDLNHRHQTLERTRTMALPGTTGLQELLNMVKRQLGSTKPARLHPTAQMSHLA
jgi:hypothetical protein